MVECVWFKCWSYRSKSHRSRGLGLEQREGWRWSVCHSNAGDLEVGAIEVGVLGLNSGKGWRWSVCGSNAGAIEVGAIEVGVLGLNSQRWWRWNV